MAPHTTGGVQPGFRTGAEWLGRGVGAKVTKRGEDAASTGLRKSMIGLIGLI